MRLKQTALTVGLLISIAAAETTAPTGKSGTAESASPWVTAASGGVDGTLAAAVSLTSLSPSNTAERICNYTDNYTFKTKCMECGQEYFEPCNTGIFSGYFPGIALFFKLFGLYICFFFFFKKKGVILLL